MRAAPVRLKPDATRPHGSFRKTGLSRPKVNSKQTTPAGLGLDSVKNGNKNVTVEVARNLQRVRAEGVYASRRLNERQFRPCSYSGRPVLDFDSSTRTSGCLHIQP